MEKQKSASKGAADSLKTKPKKQRSNVEKELVKELNVSLDEARDLVSKSQRKLSIGDNQVLTDSEQVRLKAKAIKTHEKEKLKEGEYSKNLCETCGIRTHTTGTLGLGSSELKNDNVHYGVCIKCNQDKVPPTVLKAWTEKQAKGSDSDDKEKPTVAKTPSKRFADTMIEEERRAALEKKGVCPDCGIKTHSATKFNREPLKNSNVHYGVCIKCNPDDVTAAVYQAWEEGKNKPKEEARAPKEDEETVLSTTSSKRFADKMIEEDRRKEQEKKGLCPDCGIKTHSVTKLNREALKNSDVHYGVCIKCNPDGVTPTVYKAWEDSKDPTKQVEAPKDADPPKDADKEVTKTASKRFADKMIEEDRRKEQEKKGLCPDCGIKTHSVSWFSKEALKNSKVHYGTCIKCNPDDVPEAVREEWEQKTGESEMEASSPPPRVIPVVAPTSGSETETPTSKKRPDTSFMSKTFDVPPNVSQWLEANLSQDDLSVVVLAGASGKPLKTYMKPKTDKRKSRRRRSSTHSKRESDVAPEEVAALRKDMQDMRKEMHDILHLVESAAETEAEN